MSLRGGYSSFTRAIEKSSRDLRSTIEGFGSELMGAPGLFSQAGSRFRQPQQQQGAPLRTKPFTAQLVNRGSPSLNTRRGGGMNMGAPARMTGFGTSTFGAPYQLSGFGRPSTSTVQGAGAGFEAWKEAKEQAAAQQQNTSGDPSKASDFSGVKQHGVVIDRVAKESGVPEEVIEAIMALESQGVNLAPNAAGAVGLMQVIPQYWQSVANKYGGDLTDPYTNIRTAADILKMGFDKYGSWDKAAAFFNGGDGAFDANGNIINKSDPYNGNTIYNYVSGFNNNLAALTSQSDTGGGSVNTNGQKAFPIKGYNGTMELHWGENAGAIDLFAEEGTPVLAITGGTATSGYSDIGGNWVMIIGDDGLQYYYAHLNKPANLNGRVESGQYLSGVGDTGNAKGTGAHLHLGIGHTISSGAGPAGGAGDINVIEYLNGTTRY